MAIKKRKKAKKSKRKAKKKIKGPIGIMLGGKSPSEIALSIISQLVSEKYKNKI